MATHTTEESTTDSRATASGLDPHVAGALAYVLGLISGAFFYLTEDEDEFVRFHAAQSIVVSIGLIAAWVTFGVVSNILGLAFAGSGALGMVWVVLGLFLGLIWFALMLFSLALWIGLMVSAYRGNMFRVPFAASIADRFV